MGDELQTVKRYATKMAIHDATVGLNASRSGLAGRALT